MKIALLIIILAAAGAWWLVAQNQNNMTPSPIPEEIINKSPEEVMIAPTDLPTAVITPESIPAAAAQPGQTARFKIAVPNQTDVYVTITKFGDLAGAEYEYQQLDLPTDQLAFRQNNFVVSLRGGTLAELNTYANMIKANIKNDISLSPNRPG